VGDLTRVRDVGGDAELCADRGIDVGGINQSFPGLGVCPSLVAYVKSLPRLVTTKELIKSTGRDERFLG
jgi:hypothetical protein